MIGNQKATGLWFPTRERCRSTAIFDSAAKFANVIGVPIVAFFVVGFGWRWGFAVTAFLSFLYFAAYWLMYRDPSEDRHLSRQEHAYILAGGAVPEGQAVSGQANMLAYVLQNRKVWAHMIGYSAYGYSFYLFHLAAGLSGGKPAYEHPEVGRFCHYPVDLRVAGRSFDRRLLCRLSDWARPGRIQGAQGRIACGMAAGLAVFGAAYTANPFWALVWITIALSGLSAAAPVASSIVSLISPRGATATIGGIVNLTNNLMGVAAPVITGFIVGLTHSFAGAFLVAGLVLIVGIFSYLVLLGRIEPIPDPPAEDVMPADCLIREARIVDGTGAPWFVSDSATRWTHRGNRQSIKADGIRTVDAQGLYLAPGFIDAHCHDDLICLREPERVEKIAQGVTTLVVGNCSFSLYPTAAGSAGDLREHFDPAGQCFRRRGV